MALFQGRKRWTFFDEEQTAALYPRYRHSLDASFDVDVDAPDFAAHPAFREAWVRLVRGRLGSAGWWRAPI